MARKEINIGIEGNDGTGDSIRDSFSKVNDNFQELYSVLGLGSALNFIGLGDTPPSIDDDDDRKLVVVDGVQGDIVFRRLESSATIAISYEEDPQNRQKGGIIRFTSLASSLINDPTPVLANNLNADGNKLTNLGEAELDSDAVTKSYADSKLSVAGVDAIDPGTGQTNQSFGVMTGPLVLSRDPIDDDDLVWNGRTAATKRYVDSKSYSSDFTLYVSTSGDDERANVPASLRGKSPAASYRTIQKACEEAAALVNRGTIEIGPYQKTLTYNNGVNDCTLSEIIRSPLSGSGAKAVARLGLGQVVSVVSGGSGYIKGQILTLSGGIGTEGTVTVNTVGFGGVILEVLIRTPGEYSELPPLVNNIQLVGGANTGASISATFKVVNIIVTDGGGLKTASIVGATRTNPVVITTTTPHPFETGDEITILNVAGMTQLNNNEYFIRVISNTQFELFDDQELTDTANGTAFSNYVSGGDIRQGANYGSASVIFTGGSGFGTEARTVEVGGLIREIFVVNGGGGYVGFPTLSIFLPRFLIETENKGTDFPTDLREGQLLKGLTSGAISRIISHTGARTSGKEIFDVELIAGVYTPNEVIQYGEPSSTVQVTIYVDSGVYEENYPLLLANNVTLRGTDFRRTVVRPKPGVSESPWVRRFFRRDPIIDGIRVTPIEYGYHYLTDPLDFSSQPKRNDEIDVILCNDATRLSELTFQGHGGFNMVLDPEGQILSKSPYFQTGTSISKSNSQKTFAGGQFIDGFSGNLPGILLDDINGDPSRVLIGGLDREPQLPNSFIIDGEIFRITLVNKLETNYYSAKLLLERNRTFIQEEVIAYINATFPDFAYDQEKCYRDVGLIIDSVVEDVLYGGYANSAQAGRLYFINGITVVDGQITQTVTAINRARDLAVEIINQRAVTAINANSVPQVTDPTLLDGGLAEAEVEKCFDIVANIVERGNNIYAAKNLIRTNKSFIQSEVIQRINDLYPELDYDQATCRRDVGLIVDAISIDIFGDYNNTIRAAYSYYSKGGRYIPGDQLSETIEAIEYTKTLILNVLRNETPDTVYTTQIFNPALSIDLDNNIITINNHGFVTGDRVKYSNGGGTTTQTLENKLVNDGIYFVLVIDGARFKLYESFELLESVERTELDGLEISFLSFGAGTVHSFAYDQAEDLSLTNTNLSEAGILTVVDNAFSYITTILDRGEIDPSAEDSSSIPSIYPQYECFLDTTYRYAYPSKITIGTAGNKSMLGNDFTQVNDMGYGIFATNNGLTEQVSVFTYYCYTAYYSLNGAQIRSLNGSSAHGIFGLRAEGADPVEVPDEVALKFPTIQIARVYENLDIDISNDEGDLTLYVTDFQYPPLAGSLVDINHTGDPGAGIRLGVVTYLVSSVEIRTPQNTTIPPGVAILNLIVDGGGTALRIDVPGGKYVSIRTNEELVISGKEEIVATRPSTALIFDDNPNNVIRVISFGEYKGEFAEPDDVIASSRDGFDYILLALTIDSEGQLTQPSGMGQIGSTELAIQALNFDQRTRIVFPITGEIIYDGSTRGTGGMIFAWGDSIYEITGYETINGGTDDEYAVITFVNRTVGSGGLTQAVFGVNGIPEIWAGVRSGVAGNVTVNISLTRATGHDFLDIGTGSYASTNYPSNIYGPPERSVDSSSQAVEVGKGRCFYVSTDQSGNFRVGDFFGIDQGTGVVDIGAKISLNNVQALRLKVGASIQEFSIDSSLGGAGPAGNDQVPTEAAIRTYIDRRLGLTHAGSRLDSGAIGPGYLALSGALAMKGPIDMDDFTVGGLPFPIQDRDAVPKGWMTLANLRDAPNDWLDSTPAYNTIDADVLAFIGDDAKFINARFAGDFTITRSTRTLNATISNGAINNIKVNAGAEVEQSKLNLNLAQSRSASPTNIVLAGSFIVGRRYRISAVNSTNFTLIGASSNTIGVIFLATGVGAGSGEAVDVTVAQEASGVASFSNEQFTVVNGFVTLQNATSTTTGVPLSTLSWVNAATLNANDDQSLQGSKGKVLGRRGTTTGPVYPVDFRTVIEDGEGLSRDEVPNVGVIARTQTGAGRNKFTSIQFGDGNTNGNLVQRSAETGGFQAGPITITSLTTSLAATIAGTTTGNLETNNHGIRMSINNTTQQVLTRVFDGASTGNYYTVLRDGGGGIGIRLNSSSVSSQNTSQYFASAHLFRNNAGSGAGTVNVGDGGILTTGSVSTGGLIEGQWSLSGSSRMAATWADLAEYYTSDQEYEYGTVVVFGGDFDVTMSTEFADSRVAGVVSKDPAFLMNNECPGTRVAVALQGRVPCKVKGKIRKGDLIITSDVPGVACSSIESVKFGTVIGKSLENYDSNEVGVIEVAVGRL
jgi:hypothetical protein